MESIREIYRVGQGPSSSHTMGPAKASRMFLEKYPAADHYRVTLYGSLAATGKGHLTDEAVLRAFHGRKTELAWEPAVFLPRHPNALKFEAFGASGEPAGEWTAYSVGGGSVVDDQTVSETVHVYPHSTMEAILDYCHENGLRFWEYIERHEGAGIWEFLEEIWKVMQQSIRRGLESEGTLPGVLKLPRKAGEIKAKARSYSGPFKRRAQIFAYALAVSEENASGGIIVTAPT